MFGGILCSAHERDIPGLDAAGGGTRTVMFGGILIPPFHYSCFQDGAFGFYFLVTA